MLSTTCNLVITDRSTSAQTTDVGRSGIKTAQGTGQVHRATLKGCHAAGGACLAVVPCCARTAGLGVYRALELWPGCKNEIFRDLTSVRVELRAKGRAVEGSDLERAGVMRAASSFRSVGLSTFPRLRKPSCPKRQADTLSCQVATQRNWRSPRPGRLGCPERDHVMGWVV